MNGKREKTINKLQEVLKFVKNAEISSDESLDFIDKSLNDILSSQKYIPSRQGWIFFFFGNKYTEAQFGKK